MHSIALSILLESVMQFAEENKYKFTQMQLVGNLNSHARIQ